MNAGAMLTTLTNILGSESRPICCQLLHSIVSATAGLMAGKLSNKAEKSIKSNIHGGEGGIRTHGTREGSTVFETAPFDHSGTSPRFGWCGAFIGAGVEAQGLSRKNRTAADEPAPEDPSR